MKKGVVRPTSQSALSQEFTEKKLFGKILVVRRFYFQYKMAAAEVKRVEIRTHFLDFMPFSDQQISPFLSKPIPRWLTVIKLSFQAVFRQ